ncbi:class I SAM-dependent methyltransferase [Streptomyces sp. NPDC059994]|uniref:class I SAM-dependent methyltransferase n=1 Tax=Streptomyces sp. NPDC059994 TaxID=3347029 RepID=UPI0036C0681C
MSLPSLSAVSTLAEAGQGRLARLPEQYQHLGHRLVGRRTSPLVWDAWAAEGLRSVPVSERELAFFASHAAYHRAGTAVDAGCGTGGLSRRLRDFGYRVTGLDTSVVSLDLARAHGHGLGLTYQQHDLEAGPPPGMPAGGCDLVAARLLLPFLTDPEAWLHEVRGRWLRPGGCLYLGVAFGDAGALVRGQLPREAIARLCAGWEFRARRDLGLLTCLILRSPMR